MKLRVKFTEEIETKYYEIDSKFDSLFKKWHKGDVEYQDVIPVDKKFYKEIINFIIDVLDYIINNYEKLDIEEYSDFINNYSAEFYYGPNGDNYNYLDFEVLKNGEYVTTNPIYLIPNSDRKLTKKQFQNAKKKILELLEKI